MTTPGERIVQKLRTIENERGITIFSAVEAGSRAWGMASVDSDFDVRFIYNRPDKDYQTLYNQPKDTIEIMDGDLDLVGWDVRKALRLMAKSNVSLLEHLRSPTTYWTHTTLQKEMLLSAQKYWSPKRVASHYLGLAEGHHTKYLRYRDRVRLKPYLYCLRALLSASWVVVKAETPPINFLSLIENSVDTDFSRAARRLLSLKLDDSSESDMADLDIPMNKFEAAFSALGQTTKTLVDDRFPNEELEQLLVDVREATPQWVTRD